jgi:hypothetical protein
MTPRRKREQIRFQILDTQRMIDLVGSHPVMSASFQDRLNQLQQQLDDLPADKKDPTVSLFFSGGPVMGSTGIDATFLGKALLPFQKMVQSDLVQRGYGKVGARGQIKNADDAKLYITALPRGSFGVELSKLDDANEFDEDQVADTLVHISRLIESAGQSDEEFVANLEEISARTLNGLRQFLQVVASDNAGVVIESGNVRSSLSDTQVQSAYNRVSETNTKSSQVEIRGILKGILLESWKFDFLTDEGYLISGRIGQHLSEEEVTDFMSQFFNTNCLASFAKTTVYLKNGRIKDSYELISLRV